MTEVIWLHADGQLIRSVRLALGLSPSEFARLLSSRYWSEVPVAVLLGWEADAGKPPAGVLAAVRDVAEQCLDEPAVRDRVHDTSQEDLREAT